MFTSIKNTYRKIPKKYIYIGLPLLIVIISFFAFGNGSSLKNTAVVKPADIVEKIAVTGKTKARNEVELGFDASGRIARSFVKVGDKVYQGQIIAELDVAGDSALLAKEKALLAEEQSNRGTEGAKIESSIREAYAAADNAVRNKADQFFKQPRTNPVFEAKFTDGNYIHYFAVPSESSSDLSITRRAIENTLLNFQLDLAKINSANSGSYVAISVSRMNEVSNFLDKVAYAINSFAPADFAYESTVNGYKTAIDSARSGVAAARDGIINSEGAGDSRIAQIQYSIDSLEANMRKSRIVAPFAGTITKQDAKVGQVAQNGSPLVSMFSESDKYIEADVSEIKIGRIEIGDEVEVTFDAFPGRIFSGTVVFIDPGETLVDNIPNYKIRVEISDDDGSIKNGLTANLNIKTNSKLGVMSVPLYALTKEGNKFFAEKLVDGKQVRTEVEVGLIGFDSSAEVLGGLSEGDTVAY